MQDIIDTALKLAGHLATMTKPTFSGQLYEKLCENAEQNTYVCMQEYCSVRGITELGARNV